MAVERRRVYYSGRVQGVGFRFTAERLAQRFAVSGWVRNLDDGRVEVVAEGEPSELDAYLDAIATAMHGKIRDIDSETLALGDIPLNGFTIGY
jgi:acylphosphatase